MPDKRRGRGKVLFVVIDQLRADCVSGALAGAVDLPNLRGLMAESVSFANHFSVTVPCGPARASLLTGLYAMNHRSVRNGAPLGRHHANIAWEARRAGYEPLLLGYTDTTPDPTGRAPDDPALRSYEGLLPGFTELLGLRFDSSLPWLAHLRARGYDLPPRYKDVFAAVAPGGGPARIDDPTLYAARDSDTAFLTDETLKALSVRGGEDWFAHVTYIRPHPPFAAPGPWNRHVAPEDVPPPVTPADIGAERAVHPFLDAFFAEPSQKDLHIGFDGHLDRLSPADTMALRAVYLGLAAEVDHHLGRILDHLRQTGQYEDTLIVVTGDHGEMLGDHFAWGKQTVYDPCYHVPLIVRDPRHRQATGRVVEALTESVDVAPTILEWIGATPPRAFNGRSLAPFLEGATPPGWRDHVFLECDVSDLEAPSRFERRLGLSPAQAGFAILRERRWKYVHFNGGLPPLLFDIAADPQERTDRAADPACAPELLRLARRMLDHRMTHAHHALSLTQITEGGPIHAPAPAATRRAGPDGAA